MLKGEQAVCKNAGLVRDYLYIKDVVSGIKKLIDTELQGPVNICSGELRTVGEIAEQVARMLAKEEFLYLANPASSSEPASILGTNDKLTQIGWRPEYGFDPGLREFVSTFR
jgi:nucleoside-diphosphate-sugar epimerase